MPVFNVAANQQLATPVTSYYQGKALRLAHRNAELVNERLEQEIELAPEELAIEQGNLETRRGELQARISSDMAKANEVEREAIENASAAALEAEERGEDPTGAFMAKYSMYEGVRPLPEGAVIDGDTARAFLAEADDYRKSQELTSDEQLIQRLPIPQEEKDRLLLAIAEKKGTVTGTTEYDPGGRKTGSQQGQAEVDFEDAVIGAVGAVETGKALVEISFDTPGALGKSGAVSTFGNEMKAFGSWLIDFAGYDPIPAADSQLQDQGAEAFNYDSIDMNKLELTGVEAVAFKAGIYGIAFAAAVAEQGTRPTDKDIQQFIDQVGGRSTSPSAFRRTIKQFMDRQDRRLHTIANVKGISEESQARAFKEWNKAYKEFNAALGVGGGPQIGDVEDGYTFMGGDPGSKDSWQKN